MRNWTQLGSIGFLFGALALGLGFLLLRRTDGFVQASSTDPIAVLGGSHYDAGEVPWGEPLTHEFKIKNVGYRRISIAGIERTCGCVTAEAVPTMLEPGDVGVIRVVVDMKASYGRDVKLALLNAPAVNPRVLSQLRLTAKVPFGGELYAEPSIVELGDASADQSVGRVEVNFLSKLTKLGSLKFLAPA